MVFSAQEEALRYLTVGHPFGGLAAIDVYEQEPVTDRADPLLQLDNVV